MQVTNKAEASSDLLGSGGHIVVAGGGNLKASGQRQQTNSSCRGGEVRTGNEQQQQIQ